jgi:serine/threonine protein kinase
VPISAIRINHQVKKEYVKVGRFVHRKPDRWTEFSIVPMEIRRLTVINGYTFHEKIGSGGFSQVYRVSSSKFHRDFAAKVLSPDPSDAAVTCQAYEAEIQSLLQLNHPNIIRLYDRLYYENILILILELCSKGNLEQEIIAREFHGLELDRFVSIARQMVVALSFCHDRGIAHRDIKPLNILFDDYDRPKLVDFGIADLHGTTYTANGKVQGTYAYLAPEIFMRGTIDPFKTDIWALGVTFASMLNGGLPWSLVENMATHKGRCELGLAICSGRYKIKRKLPMIIVDVIESMLSIDPSQRPTAEQLKEHPLFVLVSENPMPVRDSALSRQKSLRRAPTILPVPVMVQCKSRRSSLQRPVLAPVVRTRLMPLRLPEARMPD